MGDDGLTVREAYMQASSFLERHRVDEAKTNAERLMCHVLGWTRTKLLLHWSDPMPQEADDRLRQALERRANGEPLQYILGEQEFYGLPFRVDPSVLIPRPETELLVEAVMREADRLVGGPAAGPLHVADIGTGSGAIAVTLAHRRPQWRLTAVDISEAAIAVARGNAARNGVEERIAFLRGDLLEPLIAAGERVDVLVSNPPYITSDEMARLQREVREHEPWTALEGGADGMDCYRRMLEQVRRLPELPRRIGFEVGHTQARAVGDLMRAAGYAEIRIVHDLAGIERHVLGTLSTTKS